MFKRVFWLTVGMAIGFATSLWMYRALRQTLARYRPEQVADTVARSLHGLREDVRSALAEGREAMRRAEADLRSELRSG
ncbi:MAG TPA: hypothetical protein VG455_14805 [Acidimicrobiales bacterium]|nr:hypothetical protein [Acidimicrobiales bacterium]